MRFILMFLLCSTPLQAFPEWSVSSSDEEGQVWQRQKTTRHGFKNVLRLWKHRDTERLFLHKKTVSHSIRAESIGAHAFRLMGLPVPETHIDNTDPLHPSLLIEFYSDLRRPQCSDYKKNKKILLRALLVDILLYNYDRHRLNIRIQKSGDLLFFDHGAGMTSRAQGGAQAYPEEVDVKQIRKIMTLAVNSKRPVNLGYANWVEWQSLRQDRLVLSDPEEVSKALKEFKNTMTDDVIDNEILRPTFKGVSLHDSKRELKRRLASPKNLLLSMASKEHAEARKTLRIIMDDYDGCQFSYFSQAMKSRRDDILKLFESAVSQQVSLSS